MYAKASDETLILEASVIGALTTLAGCTELQESLIETTQPANGTQQAVTGGTRADNQGVQQVGKAIRPVSLVEQYLNDWTAE